jgi:hypothetical protein
LQQVLSKGGLMIKFSKFFSFYVILSFMVSFKATAVYDIFVCEGDFACDQQRNLAVCNGTALYPSQPPSDSSSNLLSGWDIINIGLANLAVPIIKEQVLDPLLECKMPPIIKKTTIDPLRKTWNYMHGKKIAKDTHIERALESSLDQRIIAYLKSIEEALMEEEWNKKPITFSKNKDEYLVGYRYVSPRGNDIYEIKIVGGFDPTSLQTEYYKFNQKIGPSYSISVHPMAGETPLPADRLNPTSIEIADQFRTHGTNEYKFFNRFKDSVTRKTAGEFNSLITANILACNYHLLNSDKDNYGELGERTYMFLPRPTNDLNHLNKPQAYLTIERR